MANVRPGGWEAAKKLLQGVVDTVDQNIQGATPQQHLPATLGLELMLAPVYL